MIGRRRLLFATVGGLFGAACRQVPQRPEAPPTPPSPTVDAWQAEGHQIVSDALTALRTFDVFAAYRISATPSSALRSASSLAWDPPTGPDWDQATHTSRGLHDRSNQLFQAIITTDIDPALWRTQRELADATRDVISLGDALQTYRDRIDRLPPGDASGALELLDRAWTRFDTVAPRWGLSRYEAISCEL